MLRWFILLITLGVWLVCMRQIYVNFGPQVSHNSVTADTLSLENLFDENGDVSMAWDVYVRPSEINNSNVIPFSGLDPAAPPPLSRKPPPHIDWNGFDENELLKVGHLETVIKRKFTRAEQTANLTLLIPEELRFPDPLRRIRLDSRADYSLDQGLEYCSAKLALGEMLEAYALGLRTGPEMFVTKDVSFGQKQLYHDTDKLPVGERSAPSVEIMPFQRNKNVNIKTSWDIVQLDLSGIDMGGASEPKMSSMKVSCLRTTQIKHLNSTVTVFQVESEDGTARAWYSADGVVLKQTFKFLGVFDVFIVRSGVSHSRQRAHLPLERGE